MPGLLAQIGVISEAILMQSAYRFQTGLIFLSLIKYSIFRFMMMLGKKIA